VCYHRRWDKRRMYNMRETNLICNVWRQRWLGISRYKWENSGIKDEKRQKPDYIEWVGSRSVLVWIRKLTFGFHYVYFIMRMMKPTVCTIYLQFIEITILLHVSGLLVAHHQKVTMYICENWYVLCVLVICRPADGRLRRTSCHIHCCLLMMGY
jgi:hypothetical protein